MSRPPLFTLNIKSCFCLLVLSLLTIAAVPRPALADPVAESGAAGVNAAWEADPSLPWYIELQRTGADYVRDGIAQNDPAHIQIGLSVLDWGFNHQAADGSFPGTAGGSTGQMFHSSAIFVDAAAKATLQLKTYDPVTYADAIARYTSHLQLTADWLMQPDVAAAGQLYNARFTHRRYMLASALAQVATLVSDPTEAATLQTAAADYARAGLALMMPAGSRAVITHNPDWSVPPAYLLTPDQDNPVQTDGAYDKGVHVINAWGVNPESGGYDVSYQMTGVQYAERYYKYCPDAALQAQISDMIDRACRWEISRINDSGDVLIIGSSRVGRELNRSGITKVTNVYSIKTVLLDGYKITGDVRLLDAATSLNTSQE